MRRYASFIADSARWDGFDLRDDDIVICTPSKAGTTWMQLQAALLVLDTVELERSLSWYSPWLDMLLETRDDVVARLDAQEHRRFIKTHTPLDGLPWDDRVTYVHVMRHPLAAMSSMADHRENMDGERLLSLRDQAVGLDDLGTDDQADDQADDDRSPIRHWIDDRSEAASGSSIASLEEYVHHARTFWEVRDRPNVHLFHYDDMVRDLEGQMRRLAAALDIAPGAHFDDQVRAATFESMRSAAQHLVPNADQEGWVSPTDFFRSGGERRRQDEIDPDDQAAFEARLAELASPDLAAWMTMGAGPDGSGGAHG